MLMILLLGFKTLAAHSQLESNNTSTFDPAPFSPLSPDPTELIDNFRTVSSCLATMYLPRRYVIVLITFLLCSYSIQGRPYPSPASGKQSPALRAHSIRPRQQGTIFIPTPAINPVNNASNPAVNLGQAASPISSPTLNSTTSPLVRAQSAAGRVNETLSKTAEISNNGYSLCNGLANSVMTLIAAQNQDVQVTPETTKQQAGLVALTDLTLQALQECTKLQTVVNTVAGLESSAKGQLQQAVSSGEITTVYGNAGVLDIGATYAEAQVGLAQKSFEDLSLVVSAANAMLLVIQNDLWPDNEANTDPMTGRNMVDSTNQAVMQQQGQQNAQVEQAQSQGAAEAPTNTLPVASG